jgi:WD40 repeat protein
MENENLIKLIFQGFALQHPKQTLLIMNNKVLAQIVLSLLSYDYIFKTTGKFKRVIKENSKIISLTVFDDKTLISSKGDSTFNFWDANDFHLIKTFKCFKDGDTVISVIKLPNGHIAYNSIANFKILDENFDCIKSFNTSNTFDNLLVLHNGNLVYTSRGLSESIIGATSYYIGIIDCHNGYVYNGRSSNGNFYVSCLINLDKDRIASGGKDKSIKIWNVNDRIIYLETLYEHDAAITALAFSERYSLLTSASADGDIKIWNTNDFSCIKTLQDREVTCLQTLPCLYLASLSSGKIKLWNLLDYQCINILEGNGDEVKSLLLLRDYKIVSTTLKGEIIIWN